MIDAETIKKVASSSDDIQDKIELEDINIANKENCHNWLCETCFPKKLHCTHTWKKFVDSSRCQSIKKLVGSQIALMVAKA
uniref:Uncharacterized protein n=1 Tax=Romanomermis culicivorax TaxID=13658 RepID=A0A915J445_ROMCU